MSTCSLREKHFDRLFAEEIEASHDFAGWLVRRVFGEKLPAVEHDKCSTVIGYYRLAGETDILVKVGWSTGASAVIHIEDKLNALPQPNQAERYKIAVNNEQTPLAASILVAPEAWMRRHPNETSLYNTAVSFEEIAGQLRNRADSLEIKAAIHATELVKRLRWREQLLSGAIDRRIVYQAIHSGALMDWNEAAAKVISAKNGLMLSIRPRQVSTGKTKSSRFFLFEELLSPYREGKAPLLKLKTATQNLPGRVSLEVPLASNDQVLRGKAASAKFDLSTSTKGSETLIISKTGQELQRLTITNSVATQIPGLEEAADAAQMLIEWWESRGKLCN